MEKSSFPQLNLICLIISFLLDLKVMLVHNLILHQEVQSLRGTVTVDLWTFLFFLYMTEVVLFVRTLYFNRCTLYNYREKINIIIIIIIFNLVLQEQVYRSHQGQFIGHSLHLEGYCGL